MLSENIKSLRKEKGMSQEELAEKIGVVRQTVSKWEQNLSVPDSEMLIKIADVFEVSVSSLLGETVEMNDTKSELAEISQKLENLNAMMAERNSRSRRIWLSVIAVSLFIIALLFLIYTFIILFFSISTAHSIGIIGGADGPTSILISSSGADFLSVIVSFLICISIFVLAIFLLKKAKR